jgi:RimJ/RimL family protein N-acetyltransferase
VSSCRTRALCRNSWVAATKRQCFRDTAWCLTVTPTPTWSHTLRAKMKRRPVALGWWPQRSTEATARAAYDRWALEWRSGGSIRAFAVREAAGGRLVGGCELRLQDDGSGQLSWWTHANERRKGYATRGVKLLVEYADSLGVARLEAHVAEDNDASRQVADSVGFRYLNEFTDDDGTRMVRYERRTGS